MNGSPVSLSYSTISLNSGLPFPDSLPVLFFVCDDCCSIGKLYCLQTSTVGSLVASVYYENMLNMIYHSSLVIASSKDWAQIAREAEQLVNPADSWIAGADGKPVSIGQVRDLLSFASRSPVGEKKIACLFGADQFRAETANALLKIVEEPPAFLHLFLIAERARLLPTLLSRLPRLALTGQSATIEARVSERNGWTPILDSETIRQLPNREVQKKLLYLHPLVHAGIRMEEVIEAYSGLKDNDN